MNQDEIDQVRYEEVMTAMLELGNIVTLVVSAGAFKEMTPMELIRECLDSMFEYDALPEAEKDRIEAEESEILGMFEKVLKVDSEKELEPELRKKLKKAKTSKDLLN
jgi:hypothetical protein